MDFADLFSTTYSSMSYDIEISYPYTTNQSCGISFLCINIDTVCLNLTSLKSWFSPGPDGICILNNCTSLLAAPLTAMFNMSLK